MSGALPEHVAARVAEHLGFALTQPQLRRLERATADLDRRRGPGRAAAARAGSPDFEVLVESVLVGETSWFRDERQLEAVVAIVDELPPGRRRIWSAGCATGQEPYSLAISLRRAGVWPVEVVGTDVSATALAVAADARYDLAHQRGLPPDVVRDHGQVEGDRWTVAPEIRRQVALRRHNLVRDPPLAADVVLCRNVLIYLTRAAVATALDRLRTALRPHGTLVLGHAETQLPGPAWQPVARGDVHVFRPAGPLVPGPHSSPPATPRPVARPDPTATADAAATAATATTAEPAATAEPGAEADGLLAVAEALLHDDRPADAIAPLRQARYLRPDCPVSAALLGIALGRAGHPADAHRARQVARHLLDRAPPDASLSRGTPRAVVRAWVEQGTMPAP